MMPTFMFLVVLFEFMLIGDLVCERASFWCPGSLWSSMVIVLDPIVETLHRIL